MKKYERKSVAEAFRLAKEHLSITCKDGRDKKGVYRCEFICHCLEEVYRDGKISVRTRNHTRKILYGRMNGRGTLRNWLEDRHPALTDEVCKDHNGKKMQATRAAWLDSLIAEFES